MMPSFIHFLCAMLHSTADIQCVLLQKSQEKQHKHSLSQKVQPKLTAEMMMTRMVITILGIKIQGLVFENHHPDIRKKELIVIGGWMVAEMGHKIAKVGIDA